MKKHGRNNCALHFENSSSLSSVKALFRKNSFVLYISAENLKLILNFLCHKPEVFSRASQRTQNCCYMKHSSVHVGKIKSLYLCYNYLSTYCITETDFDNQLSCFGTSGILVFGTRRAGSGLCVCCLTLVHQSFSRFLRAAYMGFSEDNSPLPPGKCTSVVHE